MEDDGETDELGEEGARRVYDFNALRKVLLIKQLLEQGRGLKRATREAEVFLQQEQDDSLQADTDRRTSEEMLQHQIERLQTLGETVRSAVQRGRVGPTDMRHLIQEIHYLLELTTYEESATLQLQEDPTAINQFRALIDQLTLHVDDRLGDALAPARRGR